ncbi:MAG: SDR family NAD(P)-dependent oxidoreductase [Phycisphaerae bacterium]
MPEEKNFGLIPIVRGLLAQPTGHPDLPWQPVILKQPGESKLPPLSLEIVDPNNIRQQWQKKIAEYESHHKTKPQAVTLPGIGVLYTQEYSVPSQPPQPFQNKIAVVTGAAGAIGYGICKHLLEQGCYLAATDLPGEKLDSFVQEFQKIGHQNIVGVPMDVTDLASVKQGFVKVIQTWGGVDLLVINAGIALAKPLLDIDLESLRRVERVNIDGTFLVLTEAGRYFKLQGTGGDVVLISTKNVYSPGAGFGAYSATKAAAHQLCRIASLEFAPLDVRVNMVAPDAVFSGGTHKSGLWAEVGPDRMKARGLDEKGLEEYYQSRNLLKVKVTADHVAKAVLFFASRQTPTTGACLPVDGGLPDAVPR